MPSAPGFMDNSHPGSMLPFGNRAGRGNKGEDAHPSSVAPWEEGTVAREDGDLGRGHCSQGEWRPEECGLSVGEATFSTPRCSQGTGD